MASPFGLSYGLGAGLATVPQAYTQGQQQGMAMSMQNLQLQEMLRQENDRKTLDAIMSAPVDKKMQTVNVMGDNPEYQKQMENMKFQADQEAANAGVEPGAFTMKPDVPEKIKTGTEQKEYEFANPYERMAYEMEERAKAMRSMGLGRAAFQLDQQAMAMNQQHIAHSTTMAVKAASLGDFATATKHAKAAYPGITQITKSPEYSDEIRVHANFNGEDVYTDLEPKTMSALMSGDHKSLEAMDWHRAQKEIKEETNKINRERMQNQDAHWRRIDELKKQNPGKTTAMITNAFAYAKYADVSLKQAFDMIAPGGSRRSLNPNQQLRAYQYAQKDFKERYGPDGPQMPRKPQEQWTERDKRQAEDARIYEENANIITNMVARKGRSDDAGGSGQEQRSYKVGDATKAKDGTYTYGNQKITVKGNKVTSVS